MTKIVYNGETDPRLCKDVIGATVASLADGDPPAPALAHVLRNEQDARERSERELQTHAARTERIERQQNGKRAEKRRRRVSLPLE